MADFLFTDFPINEQEQVEYRDIPDWLGYRVGTDGSVWSCWSRGGIVRFLTNDWRRLKTRNDKIGRPQVGLTKNGKQYQFRVCRLVLTVFVGPCPDGMQACHFPDRDPANNRLENLRWGTPTENQADRKYHGTDIRGEDQGLAKMTEFLVRNLRVDVLNGMTQRSAAIKYGIRQSTVWAIVNFKTWRHVS